MSVSEQEVPRQGMTAKSVDISQAVIEVEGAAGTVGGGALAVIWKIIARYRIRMWLAIALGIAASLCQIGPPVAVAFLVSALLEGSTNAALWWSIVLLVTPLLGIGLFMCSTLVSHFIAADAQRDQRNTIAQKLQRVPLGFFSRVSAVELRRLIVDDVEKIEDGIAHLIPELTAAFVGPLVLLAAMLIVDWRLGVAAALPTIAG
ncbi:MAG: ABC transporter transmembrane domain-containing protein, partial [Pseudomonadota bacterium]